MTAMTIPTRSTRTLYLLFLERTATAYDHSPPYPLLMMSQADQRKTHSASSKMESNTTMCCTRNEPNKILRLLNRKISLYYIQKSQRARHQSTLVYGFGVALHDAFDLMSLDLKKEKRFDHTRAATETRARHSNQRTVRLLITMHVALLKYIPMLH